MNPDAIEAALLAGKPLQAPSSAPDRQYTEDDQHARDDLDDEEEDDEDDLFTDGRRPRRSTNLAPSSGPHPEAQPFANAQGRQTGVKGVLDDRRASALASQRAQSDARAASGAEQAARAIVGMTIHEEDAQRTREIAERESKEDGEARARWRRARRHELEREKERERAQEGMKRGGLREVGKEGFLGAVERRGWVVVLIYEPDIPRCQTLLSSLLALSLTHPVSPADATGPSTPLSLFRARATSLHFSLLAPGSGTGSGATTLREEEEEDDEQEQAADGDEAGPRGRPDPDVLPTMLVYKDGELTKNWVRVDWEMGAEGIEGLLRREGIISRVQSTRRNEQESNEGDDE